MSNNDSIVMNKDNTNNDSIVINKDNTNNELMSVLSLNLDLKLDNKETQAST